MLHRTLNSPVWWRYASLFHVLLGFVFSCCWYSNFRVCYSPEYSDLCCFLASLCCFFFCVCVCVCFLLVSNYLFRVRQKVIQNYAGSWAFFLSFATFFLMFCSLLTFPFSNFCCSSYAFTFLLPCFTLCFFLASLCCFLFFFVCVCVCLFFACFELLI